ncbi:carcinoembryonic antigen-related cell adhesion molecule 5-like [Leucoraja erinacea]|uniref:carcinoembryonic antigen-related cell adhesion molecule 5-like n=1 Tax=Leucoraja erinaceus TaxID=7782 RepID=UPI00245676C3|nr:carcinoembryonic antigen-related cell adhesion molecule 5-like [Leucoraja erinacea]
MELPPLTALAFCLVISTGGSQGFTVVPDKSDLYVAIGGDAVFTVRPSSAIGSGTWVFKSKSIVQWVGTGLQFHPEYKSRVDLNLTTGSLTLRSVNESDNGVYTVNLNAVGSVAQATATIKLQALEPVSQPVITSNDARPVEYTDTVTLQCVAVGTDVSYAWSMNGLTLSPSDRLVLSNGNRTLIINGVLRSDKEFTCTGSNPLNTNTSDPFLLDVSYGPESVNISVSPEQAIHTSGTNVSLTCAAVSNPAPEYQWLFNGLLRQRGRQLVIAALGFYDMGRYTCKVFNSVTGRSNSTSRIITVFEPVSTPYIISNAISSIEHNDTVVLSCFAAGTDASYTWSEDNSVISNGGRLELSAYNTLTITGALRSDGPFTCRASNAVSAETSAPFPLNVFCKWPGHHSTLVTSPAERDDSGERGQ